jgi:hypothetical protein
VKTILSLFDYTGNWSQPYLDAGYDVIRVDIKHGQNVYLLDIDDLPTIHGILAAPPCTDFSIAGARWWAEKDAAGQTFESLALIYKTLAIIWALKARDDVAWWVLENPVGRLNSLVPQLVNFGPYYFQPCDYGDPYTKKTGLWGEFIFPDPLFVGSLAVEPTDGSKMWRLPPSDDRAELRSATPKGFARAFFEVNK